MSGVESDVSIYTALAEVRVTLMLLFAQLGVCVGEGVGVGLGGGAANDS